MKYIIVEVSAGIEGAIIFDELLSHAAVATVPTSVISAGFCNQLGDTWGRSVTLNKDSRPTDSEIVKQTMNRML